MPVETINGWSFADASRGGRTVEGYYTVLHNCQVETLEAGGRAGRPIYWVLPLCHQMKIDNVIYCNICAAKIDHILIKKLILMELK
jgi:hypothetical protein